MADNVLESGPPSAKRPKLSSPALSVSASDGNGKYRHALTYLQIKYKIAPNVCSLMCLESLQSYSATWSDTELLNN